MHCFGIYISLTYIYLHTSGRFQVLISRFHYYIMCPNSINVCIVEIPKDIRTFDLSYICGMYLLNLIYRASQYVQMSISSIYGGTPIFVLL